MIFAIIIAIIAFIITFASLSSFIATDEQEKVSIIISIIDFVLWITVIAQITILVWGITPQGE